MADPINTNATRAHFGIPHAPQTQELDAIDRLCDEVDSLRAKVVEALDWAEKHQAEADRLRAEVARLQRSSTPMGMLEQIREAIGPEAAQRARDGAGGWVGLVVEVDRLRAENAALAAGINDISRHYPYSGPKVEDVSGKCLVCGASWPCPTERAHRALAALEADR